MSTHCLIEIIATSNRKNDTQRGIKISEIKTNLIENKNIY